MTEHFLPIGSVILLKEGTKKLMITGYLPITENQPDKMFDYIGVVYPEGFLSNECNFLFDHKDINDIIFTGYANPEQEEFLARMTKAMREQEL